MTFADVILPVPVHNAFTFSIPLEWQGKVKPGCRVEVQFGVRKIYSGVVKKVHDTKPELYKIKPIRQLLDPEPLITETQIKFWEWIAAYYMCSEGEVMQAALPAHMKLGSETFVRLREDAPGSMADLTDDEYLVIEALQMRKPDASTLPDLASS